MFKNIAVFLFLAISLFNSIDACCKNDVVKQCVEII